MIPLHRPWLDTQEETAVLRVLRSGRLAGNGGECAGLDVRHVVTCLRGALGR